MCKARWLPHPHSLSVLLCLLLVTEDGGGELVVGGGAGGALGGDVEVALLGPGAAGGGTLELWGGGDAAPIATLPLAPPTTADPDPPTHLKARFSCGLVTQGGRYTIRFLPNNESLPVEDARVEVGWPGAEVSLSSVEVATYPSGPVVASLSFAPPRCPPAPGTREPETWLQLLYCGHSPIGCTRPNATHAQLLYTEQVKGYPRLRVVHLRCDLFGLAGHYALALRPSLKDTGPPIAATPDHKSLKAVWSEEFVFNVHARSIFPCSDGVQVLFQYPKCILPDKDRVRLFARPPPPGLLSPVAAPRGHANPATLRYVSEQKVIRGKYKLTFDCSLFTEANLEYCFVYVSQALTGAVSDVRMDCVPTLPVLA